MKNKIYSQYSELLDNIQNTLKKCLELSEDKSQYRDCKCIDLRKFNNNFDFDEIIFDEWCFGVCEFLHNGYDYDLCQMDLANLCELVDEIRVYYKLYTDEDIDEMTLEELCKLPLSEEKQKHIDSIFYDENTYDDEEYIEELRKAVRAEYVKLL